MIRMVRLLLQVIGALALAGVVALIAAGVVLPGWLQRQDTPAKADMIVVLAGDLHRVMRAAELYREGLAPEVLVSRDRVRPPTRASAFVTELGCVLPEPQAMRRMILERQGVPAAAIHDLGVDSLSTADEAEQLKALKGDGRFTVLLVTSPYHARRAKMTFESVLPNARFLVVSPPEGRIEPRWWRHQDSAMQVVTETAKVAYFALGGRFQAY